MVNLYDYVTPLSSPYNIQTNGRDTYSPLLYLIFKTSKTRGRGNHSPSLSSPLLSFPPLPSTLFSLQFQTHHKESSNINKKIKVSNPLTKSNLLTKFESTF
jgi:hypothetical protein